MAVEKNKESGLYDVEVDGLTYSFEKWGADASLDVLLELVKIIGRPLGAAVASLAGKQKDLGSEVRSMIDKDFDPDLIGTVFEALTERMDKGIVKSLIKKFSSESVLCDGKKIVFNSHYQDRLPHLFKVVQAALEVQYGNFSDALLAALPVAPKKPAITNHQVQ